MPIYWGIIRRLGIKVNSYLVDSQILRQLVGESGETGWFLLWIGSWKFDFAGEGGLDYSGFAENWEFEL